MTDSPVHTYLNKKELIDLRKLKAQGTSASGLDLAPETKAFRDDPPPSFASLHVSCKRTVKRKLLSIPHLNPEKWLEKGGQYGNPQKKP